MASRGSNHDYPAHYSSDRRPRSDDSYRHRYSPSQQTPPHDPRHKSPPRGPSSTMDRYHHRHNRRDRGDVEVSEHFYDDDYSRRSPPRDHGRQDYRNSNYRDRALNRSRSSSPRHRDRSPWYGGAPSREVIMEHLPVELSDKDIKAELEEFFQVEGLTDVRVIRDKRTGVSKQFGFLQFADVRSAKVFLESHYPKIRIMGQRERPTEVTLSFSREREDRDRNVPEIEWTCGNCMTSNYPRRAECYKCQASRSQYAIAPPPKAETINNGDSDVSLDSTPSQFLLFRGLEPSLSEELFVKGVAKLYKSHEPNDSKKGEAKVASTSSSSQFGAQEGSIKRVFIVRDRENDDSWRYGFAEFHTVEDTQAALAKFKSLDKFTISSKPVLVTYIHAGVFVPVYGKGEDDKFSFSASSNPSLRLAYWDQKAYLRELMVSKAPLVAGNEGATDKSVTKDTEQKSKKRKAETTVPPAVKKSMPSHLQFWKDRQAELHGTKVPKPDIKDAELESEVKTTPIETVLSYADLNRNCCYLCSRQFKTSAEVNKHERLSQLHKDNLNNEELKAKGLAKLEKAGITPRTISAPTNETQSNEYRDRAKERRQAYGQPKKPKKQPSPNRESKDDDAEGDQPRGKSKGAALLGKMGWTEGQGLGAQGTGMIAPIATDLYAEGVGLGAVGGKIGDAAEEADKRTKNSYGAFLEKTRDGARDRYESLKD